MRRLIMLSVMLLLIWAAAWAWAQENQTPIANAGPDQTVTVGDLVELDGGGSYDPDQDVLFFRWLQVSGPAAELDGVNDRRPAFQAQDQGTYVFELTVNDGLAYSAPDRVSIGALAAPGDDDTADDDDDDLAPYDPANDDEAGCGF